MTKYDVLGKRDPTSKVLQEMYGAYEGPVGMGDGSRKADGGLDSVQSHLPLWPHLWPQLTYL